jgi:hypothetical protein
MYKSTDSGASWSPINQGLDKIVAAHAAVNALLVDVDILYLATSGFGVFKSPDGGATWAAFNDGLAFLDVRSLALVRPGGEVRRSGRLGALGPGTLYRDSGRRFQNSVGRHIATFPGLGTEKQVLRAILATSESKDVEESRTMSRTGMNRPLKAIMRPE